MRAQLQSCAACFGTRASSGLRCCCCGTRKRCQVWEQPQLQWCCPLSMTTSRKRQVPIPGHDKSAHDSEIKGIASAAGAAKGPAAPASAHTAAAARLAAVLARVIADGAPTTDGSPPLAVVRRHHTHTDDWMLTAFARNPPLLGVLAAE